MGRQTKTLPVLLLSLVCVASGNAFAGNFNYRADGEPTMTERGSPRALGQLGFRYENGFGVPQDYVAAADLYRRAAEQGDTFAQSRLGLSYDRGHGVPLDDILAYKWLNLAAARAPRSQRRFYLTLRNAVASKMSLAQVSEGQRLAMIWAGNRTVDSGY